ncbi:GPN-loop GTPase 2 isoform X2 [Brevipalpus obovatus]|uniref:GPN-loop GTPase 2 isoform X2 n=1 Tax=Brevipalpus obovatus TaxID=246614 RepID=UPI003D9E3AE5
MMIIINPGNDANLPYTPAIDVTQLVSLEETMKTLNLGPNGGLIYCMEYLDKNNDWLIEKIDKLCFSGDDKLKSRPYLIFDSPGQVELYVHNNALKNVIQALTKSKVCGFDLRLASVNLVDSFYANDPGKFVSALLNSLATMMHLELPHINVLSKVDAIEKFGPIKFNIDYYCEVLDLNYLIDQIADDPFMVKFKQLSKAISEIVESYGLVTFAPLDVNDVKTMFKLMRLIDRANGHFLLDIESEEKVQEIYEETQKVDFDYAKYMEIRERLISKDEQDES